jgi:uncharacterized cupredoxin-like copper-binding protein
VLLAVVVVGLSACGDDDSTGDAGASLNTGGDSSAGTEEDPRTVEVAMVDNAFEPTQVEVEAGETVRFVFRNEGAVVHDAVIGDEAAQADHEAEMRAAEETATSGSEGEMGDMGHGATSGEGDEEAAITVEPGREGEITHTFDTAGELLIGCHEPGHYEAGMKVAVDVA